MGAEPVAVPDGDEPDEPEVVLDPSAFRPDEPPEAVELDLFRVRLHVLAPCCPK